MGVELVIYGPPDRVLNVHTGEALDLATASLDDLADARAGLGELYHERMTAAALIDAEICRRADAALASGEDFGETPRFRVYPTRGRVVEYDAKGLRHELLQRAHRNELPITAAAVEASFQPTQFTFSRHWYNMVKRWPELGELAERFAKPKRRSVRVERRREIVESTAHDLPGAA